MTIDIAKLRALFSDALPEIKYINLYCNHGLRLRDAAFFEAMLESVGELLDAAEERDRLKQTVLIWGNSMSSVDPRDEEIERLRDTAAHDGAIKKMLHSDVQHLRAEVERMRLSDGDVEALKHAAREMKWLTGMATIGEADRMNFGSAATVIQRIIDAAKGG